MISQTVREAIIAAVRSNCGLELENAEIRSVGGGCINEAYRFSPSRGGPDVFIKLNAAEKRSMFEAEAEGLAELAASGTIRVPRPLATRCTEGRAFLALEAIDLRSRSDEWSQQKLGEQLAALHRTRSPNGRFGWHRDNTIGELPQANPWTDSWADFFARHRLGAQFDRASAQGHVLRRSGELLDRVPDLLAGHEPPPSLLHGDLWGGNVAFDPAGEPVLYDPATYFGDRETDLAFTDLFGGFGAAFYRAYNAAWPLDPGFARRKPLYNLYHVVNHHNHFGGGYAAQAEAMIEALLSD